MTQRSVVVLSSELPPGPGGIGTHAHQLCLRLAGAGWDVAVVSPQDHTTDADAAAFSAAQPYEVVRVRHRRGPVLDGLGRVVQLRSTIRAHRPDVVVATGERSTWVVAATVRRPWLAVGHGTEFGTSGGAARLTRWAFGRAPLVVNVSRFTREQMLGAGIRARREVVIHNGGDDDVFAPPPDAAAARGSLRERHGLPADARVLVSVGNVSPRKAQDVVVRALPAVLAVHPTVHYLVVGLPTLGDELRALATELGVADHVHLTGRLPEADVVAAYQGADVNVFVSRSIDGDVEGYGIAAVEAALCGTPSVVSAASGLVEAVDPDETALVVPADDPGATAAAISRLLGDDALRERLGRCGLERARAGRTWRRSIAAYAAELATLAGSPSRSEQPA